MAEIISTTNIPRERGFVYFTGTDEDGNLTICRAKSGRKRKEEQKPE